MPGDDPEFKNIISKNNTKIRPKVSSELIVKSWFLIREKKIKEYEIDVNSGDVIFENSDSWEVKIKKKKYPLRYPIEYKSKQLNRLWLFEVPVTLSLSLSSFYFLTEGEPKFSRNWRRKGCITLENINLICHQQGIPKIGDRSTASIHMNTYPHLNPRPAVRRPAVLSGFYVIDKNGERALRRDYILYSDSNGYTIKNRFDDSINCNQLKEIRYLRRDTVFEVDIFLENHEKYTRIQLIINFKECQSSPLLKDVFSIPFGITPINESADPNPLYESRYATPNRKRSLHQTSPHEHQLVSKSFQAKSPISNKSFPGQLNSLSLRKGSEKIESRSLSSRSINRSKRTRVSENFADFLPDLFISNLRN